MSTSATITSRENLLLSALALAWLRQSSDTHPEDPHNADSLGIAEANLDKYATAHASSVAESSPMPMRTFVLQGTAIDRAGAVHQALGAASMAWSATPAGVFDSTYAAQIGDVLLGFLAETDGPNLALATTSDLLEELGKRVTAPPAPAETPVEAAPDPTIAAPGGVMSVQPTTADPSKVVRTGA